MQYVPDTLSDGMDFNAEADGARQKLCMQLPTAKWLLKTKQ
jgi:hypothetical protein